MRRRGLVAFWMSLDYRLRGSDGFFYCSTIPTTLLSSYPLWVGSPYIPRAA